MGRIAKIATLADTAALLMFVFGIENDWTKLYCIAAKEDEEQAAGEALNKRATRWRNSDRIKAEMRRVELLREHILQETRLEAFEDGKKAALGDAHTATETKTKLTEGRKTEAQMAIVDYTDPVLQKKKLNEIINEAKDSGEALDALKVIMQSQKNDAEAAKDKQVQRVYTPLRCHDCPLYKAAKGE